MERNDDQAWQDWLHAMADLEAVIEFEDTCRQRWTDSTQNNRRLAIHRAGAADRQVRHRAGSWLNQALASSAACHWGMPFNLALPVLRAEVAMKVIDSRREPIWAYYDFDPAGLGMASRLPRLERLLLPSQELLTASARQANQVHLFADPLPQWSPTLDSDDREIICAPWSHMQRLRLGLAQEHMDCLQL